MAQPDSPLDFGQGHWFDHLDLSRLFIWDSEDLARLAQLLGLRPGLQVADIGCGWGYLGHLLLPLISPGGRVDGFELQESLIRRGRERITEAGHSGRIVLHQADITDLNEVRDNRFDLAVCQTVLMHLSQPEQALAEMKRIVKPGGLVAAIEPNLVAARASSYDSCGGEDFEQLRRLLLVESYVSEGCQRSGAGDYRIASKLPGLMAASGLGEARLWINPKVYQCTPPYDAEARRYRDFLLAINSPEAAEAEQATWKMMFDAGGGPQELWDAYQEREQEFRSQRLRQLREGSYTMVSSNMLGVCTARVPD
jgi:2-polyprenyl-3-methyl-5-hydroxy-6-metoxy-1,4-benzoquinol methylase